MSAALPRLLVIGNSHIAAPRLAYVADSARWPTHDIDFCGLLSGNIGRLELRDGVLAPTDPAVAAEMRHYNMVRRLPVTGYDAFAIVGGLGWTGSAQLCADHRSLDFPSVIAGDAGCQLVGRRLLDAALRQRIRGSAALRLLAQLRPLGRPVLLLPEPMPSAECTADPDRFGAYVDLVARGDAPFWQAWFCRAVAAEAAPGAVPLFWPDPAREGVAFTRADLMRGALRLSPHQPEPQPATDYAHGNADYGALVMEQIVAALASRAAGAGAGAVAGAGPAAAQG
ncbi:hypothetical protein [Paracoccus spongiarum]|uniref:SGNH/GDSL hydrolase family protein n=1 Tax=Paracoccus spongiarum TaxID=3064387 RepID=A0ABT9JBE0_9RHOB|nr:hypothetical protein [Paracoccus sp. 2205BS29-5]MDP5307149.1 hypothetical protein [Paracoccus sp. 2205BS29-5]